MRKVKLRKDEIAERLIGASEHIRLASDLLDEVCIADDDALKAVESISDTGHVSVELAISLREAAAQFAETE